MTKPSIFMNSSGGYVEIKLPRSIWEPCSAPGDVTRVCEKFADDPRIVAAFEGMGNRDGSPDPFDTRESVIDLVALGYNEDPDAFAEECADKSDTELRAMALWVCACLCRDEGRDAGTLDFAGKLRKPNGRTPAIPRLTEAL